MNKTFFVVALLVAIGFSSTTGAAYALSETERYNSGYNHGFMDAKNGAASYCSTDHTYTYCQGYNVGYQARHVQTQQIPSSPPATQPPIPGTTVIPTHVDKRAQGPGAIGQGEPQTTGGFIFNPPETLAQENAQNRDIHSSFELLGGTLSNGTQSVDRTRVWNFVNETNNGTVVAKGKMIIGVPGAGGTGVEIVNHKIIWQGELWYDPVISGNSSLTHVVEMVHVWKKNLCCIHPSVLYTLKAFSTNHVQLTNGQILDDDERISGIQNNTIEMTLVKSVDHHWS
jgi:hypothetical protein